MANELMVLPPQSAKALELAKAVKLRKGLYAAHPGSGPEGETCRSCKHYGRVEYHGKIWLKCMLCRAFWTHGAGTDIKAGAPACSKWEAA